MLTRVSIYPSYPSQCSFYFVSVVVENLSASLQVVSEIVVLYVVAVLVSITGGEHRIFLICHLELEVKGLALECQFSLSVKTCSLWLVHRPCKKRASRMRRPSFILFLFLNFNFYFFDISPLAVLSVRINESKFSVFTCLNFSALP